MARVRGPSNGIPLTQVLAAKDRLPAHFLLEAPALSSTGRSMRITSISFSRVADAEEVRVAFSWPTARSLYQSGWQAGLIRGVYDSAYEQAFAADRVWIVGPSVEMSGPEDADRAFVVGYPSGEGDGRAVPSTKLLLTDFLGDSWSRTRVRWCREQGRVASRAELEELDPLINAQDTARDMLNAWWRKITPLVAAKNEGIDGLLAPNAWPTKPVSRFVPLTEILSVDDEMPSPFVKGAILVSYLDHPSEFTGSHYGQPILLTGLERCKLVDAAGEVAECPLPNTWRQLRSLWRNGRKLTAIMEASSLTWHQPWDVDRLRVPLSYLRGLRWHVERLSGVPVIRRVAGAERSPDRYSLPHRSVEDQYSVRNAYAWRPSRIKPLAMTDFHAEYADVAAAGSKVVSIEHIGLATEAQWLEAEALTESLLAAMRDVDRWWEERPLAEFPDEEWRKQSSPTKTTPDVGEAPSSTDQPAGGPPPSVPSSGSLTGSRPALVHKPLKVRLITDLTRYHPKLVIGVEGFTCEPVDIWARGSDRFTGVRFPGIAALDVLWKSLEIIHEPDATQHGESE